MNQIPFVDLGLQYRSIKSEIDGAIQAVIDETAFINGKHVAQFEENFAEAIGARHSVGVANGTDAIYIAMRVLGIGRGDEVITVANSWISTSETISQTGATPVFVDINDCFTIDVSAIEAKITSATKAIIPVHLYGQPADLRELVALCEKHDLYLIEDCAQAHLAQYGDTTVGNFGIAGTFSFYPGKNLGAYGDAGAIVSNDDAFALECKKFARHGALKKHDHEIEGINSRLDGIQAAVLNVKLPYLANWTDARQENAQLYRKHLSSVTGITLPVVSGDRSHVYHLFVIRCADRQGLGQELKKAGIGTAVHYPTPLPLLPAYSYLGHDAAEFPVAVQYQSEIISLPMFAELTEAQIIRIAEVVSGFM